MLLGMATCEKGLCINWDAQQPLAHARPHSLLPLPLTLQQHSPALSTAVTSLYIAVVWGILHRDEGDGLENKRVSPDECFG